MRWWWRRPKDSDFERELQAHLDLEAEAHDSEGVSEKQAGDAARRALGNPTLLKESLRDGWGWNFLETVMQDLRYALRGLRRSPVFAVIAIASLGLGIGANTAIFSFVNALLLKQLPVPAPDRLVQFNEYEDGKFANSVYSYPFLTELSKQGVFESVLGTFAVRVNLSVNGASEPLTGEVVTGDYFRTLRTRPALGRLLTQQDIDTAAASPVCVVSYATWRERFAGDPAIIGRKLTLNAHPYVVVGVTEKYFQGSTLQTRFDVQLPISRMGDFMGGFFSSDNGKGMWKSAGFSWLMPLARLKPGVTQAQAQAALNPVARALWKQLNRGGRAVKRQEFQLADGSQGTGHYSSYSLPVKVLMGVVALVLLIACANLANLLLARAGVRAKEFAVRLSLGASRFRLVRQLMVENLLIAAAGGMTGVLLAVWIVHTLLLYMNAGHSASQTLQVSPDPPLAGFLIGLSLLTCLLFGLAPALQSARPDVVPELKEGSGERRNHGGINLRRSLIASQIALSVVLLFGATLMTQTLRNLKTIDLGFKPAHVVELSADPAMAGYRPAETEPILDEVLGRLRAQPRIAAASLAVVSPLSGGMFSLDFEVPGRLTKGSDVQTNFNMVSPDYFKTLDQPLLAGRDFSDRDVMKAPGVAIVNPLFVQQYMPGMNPLGRHIKIGTSDTQIIGVVGNARYQTLRETPTPLIYLPAKQTYNSGYITLVRTRTDATQAVSDIEHTIRSVDPRIPIYEVHTLQDRIDQGISPERILSFLSSLFSGLATLLCGIGLYGIVAYSVSRRTREIGVRFAVGAQKSDVARLFLRESALLIGAGVVVGIPAALAVTRFLKSLLFGVAGNDIPALVLTVGVLIAAGLLATSVPVSKAARTEPLQALRHE